MLYRLWVTSTVLPFTKPGQTIDVSVAVIGLAPVSPCGGNLILMEFRGDDLWQAGRSPLFSGVPTWLQGQRSQ